MSYVIGSFNTLKLNLTSTENRAKDFKKIAEIINDEGFDVVALQEAVSEMAIKNLLMPALGTQKWDYCWESPKTISGSAAEGYAYIWRKRRLKLVEFDGNPMIYSKYRIKRHTGRGSLIRPPYVARFTPQGLPGGSNFEFRLINTHVMFGKSAYLKDTMEDDDMRRAELKTLSEEVYRLVSSKRYGDDMPAYTILLGDYNLCLCGAGPYIEEVIEISERKKLRTVQTEKTSLKSLTSDTNDNNGEGRDNVIYDSSLSKDYYSRNYDHFSYETDLDDKMSLVATRVEALGKYYNYELSDYRREISDHVPIKLMVDLKIK